MLSCIFHTRLNDVAAVVDTVIVIEFCPLKLTYTCCPLLSPQIMGTRELPPDIWMLSTVHSPSPFGCESVNALKSTLNWQTVLSGGMTVYVHLLKEVNIQV